MLPKPPVRNLLIPACNILDSKGYVVDLAEKVRLADSCERVNLLINYLRKKVAQGYDVNEFQVDIHHKAQMELNLFYDGHGYSETLVPLNTVLDRTPQVKDS